MEEIMNITPPPAGGELNFAANKEAYENYFVNVAGILAAHNQFQNKFLLRLNNTLSTFGLKLISLKIQHEREEAIKRDMYLEAEDGVKLLRVRYINQANDRIREIIAKKNIEIEALVKQIEEQEKEIERLKASKWPGHDNLPSEHYNLPPGHYNLPPEHDNLPSEHDNLHPEFKY
jgi:molybdopterin-guanine dinucleotide biosynthesis protein A